MIGEIVSIIMDLIFLAIILTMAFAAISAAPWVPARSSDVKRILKLAQIKKGQKVYDLGCGDARLVCAFAKEGAKATGYEISLIQYLQSLIRLFFVGNLNASVKFKNFWNEDLHDADIIYIFLMSHIYPKLKEKFRKELKKGTTVIVYAFKIDGWEPVLVDEIKGKQPIYVYKI